MLSLQIESAASTCSCFGIDDLAASIGRLEGLDAPDAAALIADAGRALRYCAAWTGTLTRAGDEADDLHAAGRRLVMGPSGVALFRDTVLAARRRF